MSSLSVALRRVAVALVATFTGLAGAVLAPATPAAAQADCLEVSFTTSHWPSGPDGGGYVVYITVTNTCPYPVTGWELTFTLPPAHTLDQGWSAQWSVSGDQVAVSHEPWNAVLAPGAATTFGFVGSYAGTFQAPPWSCAINGVPCGGGGNAPPEVALSSPSGSGVPGICPVPLAATATDPDGEVTRVEFYVNGTLVGTDHAAPYELDLAATDPVLTGIGNTAHARAYDDGSPEQVGFSPTVTFDQLPIPPALLLVACTPRLAVPAGGDAVAVFASGCGAPTQVDVTVTGEQGVTVSPTSYLTTQDGSGDRVTVAAAPGTAAGATATVTAASTDGSCLPASVAVTVTG